jgi:Zn-dependent protease with chaperone function
VIRNYQSAMTTPMSPKPPELALPPDLSLALEEYRTVREEELIAVQGQISTLRYGVAGCVVLIGFAAQQHGDRYLGWAVSLALVPLVVLFSAVIWMGEYERGARAGSYISELEPRINAMLGLLGLSRPLRWEGWLREGGNAPSRLVGGHHRYLAIACVFIGFQIAAVVMGLHFYWHKHSEDANRHWLIPVAVIVNLTILMMLLGYFRSSYERLRNYTTEPEEPRPIVRQRVRMRISLYFLFLAVGFLSTPFFLGALGVWLWASGRTLVFEGLPDFWVLVPAFIWMTVIPLVSSRGLMRELFARRILWEEKLDSETKEGLGERGALGQLTQWEVDRLHVVVSKALNAPSIGRGKHITVTTASLAEESDLPGVLAHEIGHHRLHHLHSLSLSYLYLWPYLYLDDRFSRKRDKAGERRKLRRRAARALFSVIALPGWLAWVVLRVFWRTAEYDADRFACVSGHGETLKVALRRADRQRDEAQPRQWGEYLEGCRRRLRQGRGLGLLPVPNEHPTPRRRLHRVENQLWTMTTLHTAGPGTGSTGQEATSET